MTEKLSSQLWQEIGNLCQTSPGWQLNSRWSEVFLASFALLLPGSCGRDEAGLAGFFNAMLSEFADFLKNKSRKDRPAKQDASPRTRPQDEASSSRAGRASVVFA
jgi:hypothetical protein